MPEKTDFKKALKALYNPPKSGFQIGEVPALSYLMVDGKGDPNVAPEYKQAIEILYSVAYGIKFALKPMGLEYVVPPPEGLWWVENMNDFTMENKDQWKWTMMIMQPKEVTTDIVDQISDKVRKKLSLDNTMSLRFEPYYEGLVVQVLYIGAYDNEAPVIAKMHDYIHMNGFARNGKHHEIYLSDVRKTSADRLKTILRQPIRKL